jgi:iron complex transport system substrate-binding protein
MVVMLFMAGYPFPDTVFGSVTVNDATGRSVKLENHPRRLVCIGPGTLRLIVYLQAQDRLVGIEDIEKRFPDTRPYFIANPQLANLPSVGPGGPNSINKEPDYEKILSVNPDIIFVSYMEADLAERVQKKIGIPVFVLSYGPFGTFTDSVFDSIMAAGQVLDTGERAQMVVNYFQKIRRDLRTRVIGVPEEEKPSVYIGGIGLKGTQGIESTETDYAPFNWVAAKNVVKQEGKKGHLFVGKERLLAIDPDIIFIDGGGNDLVRQDYEKKTAFYSGLSAFHKKEVYTLYPFNWYMTNLGTVVADAYAVGKILYPEQFAEIELSRKADAVYTFLLGRPVYDALRRTQGELGQTASFIR